MARIHEKIVNPYSSGSIHRGTGLPGLTGFPKPLKLEGNKPPAPLLLRILDDLFPGKEKDPLKELFNEE